jgi:hypothetical protein
MQRYKSRLTIVVLGVIALLLMGTVVWASPQASPHSAKRAEMHLAVNPFEIEITSELGHNLYLQFEHHWLGYTEIWSSGDPLGPAYQGSIYVPVHNPVTLLGKPLKLESIEVCYQVTPGSYIGRTAVFFADRGGGRTQILDSGTDRTSTSWTCYTVTNDTPQLIEGPLLVYFLVHFAASDGDSDMVSIGQITLTLTK